MSKRNELALIMLAIAGLFAFLWFQWQDPSLHQDTNVVTSEAAVSRSGQFWQGLGVQVAGLEVTATLEGANEVDGYLNRYDLYEEYRQHAPKEAPLAFWKVTFYQKDGTNTYITKVGYNSGNVVSFKRIDDAGARPADVDQARQAAETALQRVGIGTERLHLRTDTGEGTMRTRMFVKENTGFTVKDLTERSLIEVTGDKVTNLDYEYIVPESFTSWRDWQTKIGSLLTLLSLLFSFVLAVLALVFLFVLKRKKPYYSALWLSLLLFGLFLFSNLNQWPVFKQQVLAGGGDSMNVLVAGSFAVLAVVILALLSAASTYPMILTGGMLVNEVKPKLWTSWQDSRWPATLRRAVWHGYLLAMIWLGLQGVFYWLGESYFHVWYEQDFTMSPDNMWWPLLFPLLAWLAGIQEELTYRLFGVTFFKRFLKNSFVATLLPAMVWALGHSLYPVYPIYTRFVELTIIGVLIGYCYLWFGIETVIFAHIIFDTILMCIPLLVSGDAMQIGSGILFLILPVPVAWGLGVLRPRPKRETADTP